MSESFVIRVVYKDSLGNPRISIYTVTGNKDDIESKVKKIFSDDALVEVVGNYSGSIEDEEVLDENQSTSEDSKEKKDEFSKEVSTESEVVLKEWEGEKIE